MKIRNGFVTNSSSSSFIITNKTNEDKTLYDFIKENPQLVENFLEGYSWHSSDEFNQEALLKEALPENKPSWYNDFPANSSEVHVFGDEDGTLIGYVFDYMLRDGGESESFKWHYHESLR